MPLLLDTHAFLWWVFGDPRLSRHAGDAIAAAIDEVFVSPVTAWEITTKYRIGKLPHAAVVAIDVPGAVAGEAFRELPLTMAHGQLAGTMAGQHRNPFDWMLMA